MGIEKKEESSNGWSKPNRALPGDHDGGLPPLKSFYVLRENNYLQSHFKDNKSKSASLIYSHRSF